VQLAKWRPAEGYVLCNYCSLFVYLPTGSIESVIKMTPITERIEFQLKLKLLNALNRHAWALPNVTPTDNLLGIPTNTLTTPRNLQITGRVQF
jgi:hypothetical protein